MQPLSFCESIPSEPEVRHHVVNIFSIGAALFVLVYFLPIYFQAVRNTTAQESGIRNLALVIAVSE